MRRYEIDSPQAAGRIIALTMVVDGNLSPVELSVMESSRILETVQLDQAAFRQLLQELCDDLLTASAHGLVQLEPRLIDTVLGEIVDPDLRRALLQAMWKIADADDWLADGEAVLLGRAISLWAAETNFINRLPGKGRLVAAA